MSSISFDNPWLLFLMLPLVAVFLIPFFIAIRKDNANGHNIASCVMHVVMAVIIAFVAAGTSVVTTVTETDVYVLADVSYSANRNLDTIDGYISDLRRTLPDNSRMGVICFGKDYQLITRLGERVKSVKTAEVDDSATDIVNALDFAGSLFRDNVIKRIVLITDGKQTNDSDSNALKRQVEALADRKVHVDAIYLDDNIKENAREVQLSDVRYTQSACLNRTEKATLTVNVSCPEKTADGSDYIAEVILTVKRNGEAHYSNTQYLTRGSNNVTVPLYTAQPGTYDYEATIECKEDQNTINNRISFTQTVSDELSVLLITDSSSDEYEDDYHTISSLYGSSTKITAFTYLQDPSIPITVEDLCRYDEIVLSNVDLTKMPDYGMFLSSLDTTVSLFGKSLITFGNVYVQAYGAGELGTLGDMLPVQYGKTSQTDRKLYTIAIDTSRSMEHYVGNLDRAKEAAKEIVNKLSNNDSVAVVSFNGRPDYVRDAAPLSTDRAAILKAIDDLEIRQGTDISNGLNRVFDIMSGKDYSEKQVMLISDGLNWDVGESTDVDSPEGWVNKLRNHDIFTSTLDVGRGFDTGSTTNDAKALLERLAELGGGECYDITNSNAFDKFINGGSQSLGGNSEKYERFSSVNVKRRADDVLQGVSLNKLTGSGSLIGGFMLSMAKNSATTVFTVDYYKQSANANFESERIEAPLYSYWDYGNGKVATFTSKVNGRWVSLWNADEKQKFFTNVLTLNFPSEKSDYPFVLDIEAAEGHASVKLTPQTVRIDAVTGIEITAPDGKVTKGTLSFGTSTFNYNFVTPDEGKYTVKIDYAYNGRAFTANRTVHVSYSSEYDSFALYDAAVLHKIIGANGTVSEDGKLQIVNDPNEVGLYNMSLSIPLLAICVAIYAVDIAVRKLKWEDIKSLFGRGGKVKK